MRERKRTDVESAAPRRGAGRAIKPIFQETLEDPQFATTLARGLEILRCFTPQTPELGNKDFVRRTGLPKATVSRFTYTLTRLGYLRQAAGQSKYRLGAATLSLGYPLLATLYVRQLARMQMSELAAELGASVAMGIRNGLDMVYVETARPPRGLSPPFTEIGYGHPIVATSMGRAFLSVCDPKLRAAIVNEIRVTIPELWRRYRGSVEKSLEDYKRQGFCTSVDCFRPGIYGAAVPMRRPIAGEIIVFNCAVYSDDVSAEDLKTRIGPRLLKLCRSVENSLHAA